VDDPPGPNSTTRKTARSDLSRAITVRERILSEAGLDIRLHV